MDNDILTKLNSETIVSDAYKRVEADLAALEQQELVQVNLDVTAAVTTVLGVLPEVKALREQIAQHLPTFDLVSFDKLEDYTLALHSAQTDYLTATQPPDDLVELSAEATKARDRLYKDALALAGHGLVDSGPLAQIKGGNGYKVMAQDLEILSRVMNASWDKIQGKSATTVEHLQTASRMSTRLMRIVGLREQGPAILAAAADHRLRAFTKMLFVYEDARRAVGYLRARQGDADNIAPSLYPGRPRRRSTEEPATPATDNSPGVPTVSTPASPAAPIPTPAATNNLLVSKNGPFAS
jgi:hypothetical protein